MPKGIALIPARGGSKRIPRKNMIEFSGRPLIAWTIEAARKAACIERVLVSTDHEGIANVARQWGAEVPFLRPRTLARDASPSIDAAIHAAQFLKQKGTPANTPLVLLQPTSPLRHARDIDKAFSVFMKRRSGSVVSVRRLSYPPCWAFQVTPQGVLKRCAMDPALLKLPSQLLPAFAGPNGAIYIARLDRLLARRTFFIDPIHPYLMDEARSIDIDTPQDLADALLAFSKNR